MAHYIGGSLEILPQHDRPERRQSAARRLDRAVRRAAARPRSSRSTLRPAFEQRARGRIAPRSPRSPMTTAAPDFDNTVAALERSGRLLARVCSVFYVLAGAHTSEAIQAIERDMAPMLARHWNEIHLNEALFARLDALHTRREPRPHGRAGAGAGALPRAVPPRGRRTRCGREAAAEGDRRPARDARHDASARTCLPTSSPTRCRWARTTSPACRISRAPRRAGPRRSAACRATS